jgi:hypothetical protein
VAEAAAVALRRLPAFLDQLGLGALGRRHGRRELGDLVRIGAQVVVGKVLGQLVHRLGEALLLAELVELDQREGGRLRAERGHLGGRRGAFLAVAGKAGREALRHVLGQGRRGPDEGRGGDHRGDGRAHGPAAARTAISHS